MCLCMCVRGVVMWWYSVCFNYTHSYPREENLTRLNWNRLYGEKEIRPKIHLCGREKDTLKSLNSRTVFYFARVCVCVVACIISRYLR